MSIYIWDKEIKNLFAWEPIKDYSAMRWPCPEGFHVPLKTEWQSVYDIWTALSWWSSSSGFKEALKMPAAGKRMANSNTIHQNEQGYYRSSTHGPSNTAYNLYFLNGVVPDNHTGTPQGFTVRWFKDSPVIPTLSWTKLYWTSIEAGWIFWNSSEWLISLSSDWQTWITIQDKNLWATQVWNSWDNCSEANCGKYYQWWNCYWFSFTWSITTSSTKVNASWYWPWNYYTSSTFITTNGSVRDSSNNYNLRWWVTWITLKQKEAKAVYLWDIKVRPAAQYRTLTLSYTEWATPAFADYSDDATWRSAESTDFDEFFWYYWCRLNTSWQETATVTQVQSWWNWKLDITQLWTLTSWDNVMIAFPRRWIKMSKSWSTVTISITDDPNKEWFQYYAFTRWTTVKSRFYLSAYKASRISNVLKSYSWQWEASSASANGISYISLDTACSHAQANWAWYDCETRWMRNYINALFVLKYKTLNSQSKVWAWYTWWSANRSTWVTNSITNATWATNTSNTWRIKIFWLEDWWWNIYEWLNWAYYNWYLKMQLWTLPESPSWRITNFSYYDAVTWTSSTAAITVESWWMSSAVANNAWMFASNGKSWSNSTYYCDNFGIGSESWLMAGGTNVGSTGAGAFCVSSNTASFANSYDGARLAFL